MRFKLVLSVQTELSGNILPVSYQYELSSCVHRILTAGKRRIYKKSLSGQRYIGRRQEVSGCFQNR